MQGPPNVGYHCAHRVELVYQHPRVEGSSRMCNYHGLDSDNSDVCKSLGRFLNANSELAPDFDVYACLSARKADALQRTQPCELCSTFSHLVQFSTSLPALAYEMHQKISLIDLQNPNMQEWPGEGPGRSFEYEIRSISS